MGLGEDECGEDEGGECASEAADPPAVAAGVGEVEAGFGEGWGGGAGGDGRLGGGGEGGGGGNRGVPTGEIDVFGGEAFVGCEGRGAFGDGAGDEAEDFRVVHEVQALGAAVCGGVRTAEDWQWGELHGDHGLGGLIDVGLA